MRSPKYMRTIQIDITNACIHKCSNCTRMCGHHKKNFFMDWYTFKRAIDSLEGFEGTVGMMGGEPTLHPEFERFASYLNEKFGVNKFRSALIEPTDNFMKTLNLDIRENFEAYESPYEDNPLRVRGPGLFSSLCSSYYKHYETIQDIFRYQCLNDHNNVSYHKPVLIARKDLGIDDEQWYEMRDKCWLQNSWSATITPKGAFFCEIAGALDMLFNGNGGWEIEKDWWKREPKDFSEQLHWCELCGIALNTRSRNANEEIDDVSPYLYEKLKKIGSPKLKSEKINIYNCKEKILDKIRDGNYSNNYFERISDKNKSMYPHGFEGIVFYDNEISYNDLVSNILKNITQLKKMIIVVDNDKLLNKLNNDKSIQNNNIYILKLDNCNFGQKFNQAKSYIDTKDFILVLAPNLILSSNFKDKMSKYILNPGTLHYNIFSHISESNLDLINIDNNSQEGYILLCNLNAISLKEAGFDRLSQCNNIEDFKSIWDKRKLVCFDNKIFTNADIVSKIEVAHDYVIYGTGKGGETATEFVIKNGGNIKYYCDSNKEKWGNKFLDKCIISPNELLKHRKDYDKIIIASMALTQIRQNLFELGFMESDILIPCLDL